MIRVVQRSFTPYYDNNKTDPRGHHVKKNRVRYVPLCAQLPHSPTTAAPNPSTKKKRKKNYGLYLVSSALPTRNLIASPPDYQTRITSNRRALRATNATADPCGGAYGITSPSSKKVNGGDGQPFPLVDHSPHRFRMQQRLTTYNVRAPECIGGQNPPTPSTVISLVPLAYAFPVPFCKKKKQTILSTPPRTHLAGTRRSTGDPFSVRHNKTYLWQTNLHDAIKSRRSAKTGEKYKKKKNKRKKQGCKTEKSIDDKPTRCFNISGVLELSYHLSSSTRY